MSRKKKRKKAAAERTVETPAPAPANYGPWSAPTRSVYFDGEKYPGGYGPTDILTTDYWTLRARSSELFEKNLYARGIIRRLVTNEINTGLHLEAAPEEAILGLPEDSLAGWTETVENRFRLWEKDPWLCHAEERLSFGGLQRAARMEALISGDVLVVLTQHQTTKLPRVQLISGAAVQTPLRTQTRTGHRIEHGVELDAQGRQVAYWVRQEDGTSKRLPAWGEKSGRRLAWLVYGVPMRLDAVRGTPMLALVLQSLKEIDRYRDATLRKAVVNSMLAMFIKKTQERKGSLPMSGGAQRAGIVTGQANDGSPRSFRTTEHIPGYVIDELQFGEEPVAFSAQGTVEEFGKFEEAIVQAMAWTYEIPPEIVRLSFSSNYSASQAAINELKMYLNVVRTAFGEDFCQPIYTEWLLCEVLSQKIEAPRLLESWRDARQYDVFGAWTAADWSGHIKPAVDPAKLVRGYAEMVAEGFITRDRASRELTGTKYSKNVAKLARENAQLAEAMKPIAETKAPPAPADAHPDSDDETDVVDEEQDVEESTAREERKAV